MKVITIRTSISSSAGTGGSNWFNTLTVTFMKDINICESMTSRGPRLLRTHSTTLPWMVPQYTLQCVMLLLITLDPCTLISSWEGPCAMGAYAFPGLVLMAVCMWSPRYDLTPIPRPYPRGRTRGLRGLDYSFSALFRTSSLTMGTVQCQTYGSHRGTFGWQMQFGVSDHQTVTDSAKRKVQVCNCKASS